MIFGLRSCRGISKIKISKVIKSLLIPKLSLKIIGINKLLLNNIKFIYYFFEAPVEISFYFFLKFLYIFI